MANRPRASPYVLGADRLGRILDDDQPMCLGERDHGIHVRHLAVQVHRNDGAGPARHLGRDLGRVQVVRRWIDVDEDRRRAHAGNRTRRREKRVRRRDDLVAGADVLRHQADEQGIAAR